MPRRNDAIRRLWSVLRSVVATAMTCAVISLPSCASMGGGGMKGMFSEAPAAAQDVSG